jgi:hypothetical protein
MGERERQLGTAPGDGQGCSPALARPTPEQAAAGLRREIEKLARLNRWWQLAHGGEER